MGLWKKIFGLVAGRAKEEEESEWEDIVYDHTEVDFSDEEQRSRYVTECLEQMAEAAREINQLNGEYSLVTAYLTDMEELEALPSNQREEINQVANKLLALERERQKYLDKKNSMRDSDYYNIRKQENEVQEGISKLKEAEQYNKLVKKDMKRLDGERQAFAYRRNELLTAQTNLRGMAVIFICALVACMIMLAVLQFGFEMNTYAGYFIAVLAGAISVTVVCVKYMDAEKEIGSVERSISRLIQLQNKVKIRYVNNTNLLNYLCMKYDTDNSANLETLWNAYLEEKEARKQFAEAEAKSEYYQKELVRQLSQFRVSDPARWINQVKALLDPREMVEIRHELIVRRQSLRQQLEYNNNVVQTARNEIVAVAAEYPKWAADIMDMVDKYDMNI